MNVLWLSNVLFPEVCRELKLPIPVIGGWMEAGAKALLQFDPDIKLSVIALYTGEELRCIKSYKIKYYLVPFNSKLIEKYMKQIRDEVHPDLAHIHGTEHPHSLAYVNGCGTKKVVVSVQGLVSIYAKYYLGLLPKYEIKPSIRDIIRKDWAALQQENMSSRGKLEIELISKIKHVIGRTSWDQSNVWAINPKANYYIGNETLRPAFYNKAWSHLDCEKFSIFLSQAHYPIKGLQQFIKAIPLIKRHYPALKVYVAGHNFINVSILRKNGFANYIENLMNTYDAKEHIIFLGTLSEEEMAIRYMKSHVFVCPSAIENSPNSIGEAQLIGVPCVASYVGGSMDMINDGETGFLYRYEETTLLAFRICQLFSDPRLCEYLSSNGQVSARERHDPDRNAQELVNIYKSILRND